MRRSDTIRGREVEDRRKEEEMTTPITLPPMDEQTLSELLCWLHRMSILKKRAAEEETFHMTSTIEPFEMNEIHAARILWPCVSLHKEEVPFGL
jgi:hypothetical protein